MGRKRKKRTKRDISKHEEKSMHKKKKEIR
jgi:hypothetical protein